MSSCQKTSCQETSFLSVLCLPLIEICGRSLRETDLHLDSVYKLRSKTKEDMKPDESDNNSECSEYSPPRYHNEQKNQKDGCCSCFDPDIFWHPFYRPIRKVFHEVFKFFGELCGDIFDIDD